MKLLEKILLTTDFTKVSDCALQIGIAIAKTFDSEIMITHVIPDSHTHNKTLDIANQAVGSNLEQRRNEIIENKVNVSNVHLVTGNPFDQIITQADSHDVNLIMMGSREKDGYQLSITTHKVIKKSSKPVWVVGTNASSTIKNVLCPVDFSSPSCCALKNAIHLARNLNAKLTVMTVIESIERDHIGFSVKPYDQEGRYIQCQQQFNKFLKDFNLYNVKWDKVIRKGKPYQEILKINYDNKTDLIVMGVTGITGSAENHIGSVTDKVLKEVPCSVLTLKSEDVIRLRLEKDMKNNIEELFKEGKELMEQGFDDEALIQFRLCLDIDSYFEPAWKYSAIAYERLEKKEAAENSQRQAKLCQERHWQQLVEADIRNHHALFSKHNQQ
ncbi:MAG: universal stress protein [Candidatus Anammoxibacter sp.]